MNNQKRNAHKGTVAFESITKSIEKLLEKIENDGTSLEQSLLAFEEGVKLTREAQKTLLEADQKLQILLEKDNDPVIEEVNFDEIDR